MEFGIILIIILVCGVYLWGRFASGDHSEKSMEGGSDISVYILSFIVPLVAFIFGSISLSKDSHKDKEVGTKCILLGITSSIVYLIIMYYFL